MDIIVNEKIFLLFLCIVHRVKGVKEDEQFYNELSSEIMPRDGECIIMEDLNAHVGNSVDDIEGVYGGYCCGQQN